MDFQQIWPVLAAALANIVIGFIYYNPKVMGKIWIKEANLDETEMKKANMVKVMGFSILFALMLSISMSSMVVHQSHLDSLAANELGSSDVSVAGKAKADVAFFKEMYGNSFISFKHGALHGFLSCLFIILPVIGMNSLYEGRSWKYIFIHLGYWLISFTVMGGIICANA